MKLAGWIATAVLFALLVRTVWPKVDTVTQTITLPGQTITDTVTVPELDSIVRLVYRDRVVYSTDTVVLRDTVWRTLPDTLDALPFAWYLTRLQAGQALTDNTYVSALGLKYDGALTAVQSLEQYPVTLGPVKHIVADSLGVHLDFGTWPEPPKTCGVGCIAQWTLGGLAAGIIVGSAF